MFRVLKNIGLIFVVTSICAAGSGSLGQCVVFGAPQWLYYPSGAITQTIYDADPVTVIDGGERGIERATNVGLNHCTVYRHRQDFLTHMLGQVDSMPVTKKSVIKKINRLVKKTEQNVRSRYIIFNILYQTTVLSPKEKILWIKSHLKDDLPQAPFMYLVSLLEEDMDQKLAWSWVAAWRAEQDANMITEKAGAGNAANLLKLWHRKEMYERYLVGKQGYFDVEPFNAEENSSSISVSGLDVLVEFYGVTLSNDFMQQLKEGITWDLYTKYIQGQKIESENDFKLQLIDDEVQYYYWTIYDAFKKEISLYLKDSSNKQQVNQAVQKIYDEYLTNRKPYYAVFNSMLFIYVPDARTDRAFKSKINPNKEIELM